MGTPPGTKVSIPLTAGDAEDGLGSIHADGKRTQAEDQIVRFDNTGAKSSRPAYRPFDASTRSFVYGLQPRAIQGMLDFDFSCGRETPSVAAMIYPFGGHHIQKFYWGTKETLLPVYTSLDMVSANPEADLSVSCILLINMTRKFMSQWRETA